jgi:hypothetical protein
MESECELEFQSDSEKSEKNNKKIKNEYKNRYNSNLCSESSRPVRGSAVTARNKLKRLFDEQLNHDRGSKLF